MTPPARALMRPRHFWASFALVCLLAAALLWTERRGYAACDSDGCVVIDRWSGAIVFQGTGEETAPEAGTTVVVRGPRRVERGHTSRTTPVTPTFYTSTRQP